MIHDIIFLVIGLFLVVKGADFLVDGSSSIARKFKVSEFVIGLTIVGMGTSAPEMVVSWLGAIKGNSDVALGNVLGSNIFNTLLILGLTAIILPIGITQSNKRRDIPTNIAASVLLLLLGFSQTLFSFGGDGLSRVKGIVMLVFFALYIWMSFLKQDKDENPSQEAAKPVFISILMVLGGLAALVFGGNLFVDNATSIAKALNISDKFIAITILAGGTSLPELATCIAAAVKKKGALALGNIIGSNLFNILLILGGAAVIHPVSFASLNLVDCGVFLLSALLLLGSCFIGKKNKIDRLDGVLFTLIWLAYMTYLVINL